MVAAVPPLAPSSVSKLGQSRGSDSEDRKGTGRAAAYHDSSDNDNDSNNKPRSGGKPLTVKEQDEMMLERMKERMGLEGDERELEKGQGQLDSGGDREGKIRRTLSLHDEAALDVCDKRGE